MEAIHSVFVDFENVPTLDLGLVEGKPVRVTLLIGKRQTKMDLPLVRQIHRLAGQVELVEVGAAGHNALDLTLAYYLGVAARTFPAAQFSIVSKDKDFEPLISHLKGRGVSVSRHDSFAALPFLAAHRNPASRAPFVTAKPAANSSSKASGPSTAPKAKAEADKLMKFILHLRNAPPSSRTKLEHMITAYFKPSLPVGGLKGIVAELTKQKVVFIDGSGRVKCL